MKPSTRCVIGCVRFTDPAARNVYSGASLPDRHNAPSAALAPYWSDLVVDASASVWTAVTGTGTDQRYVIEWRNALLAGTASRVSFETVIANNGDITFNYTGLADDLAKGSYTAVGVTSPGGNYGLQYSYEQPDLAAGTAVTVVAPADGHDLVGSLTGTMLNQEGEPTAGVHVWLDDTATETDEFGTYRFDDVENGTYSLYGAQGCADVEDANVAVTGDGTIDTVYDAVMDVATDTYGNRCSLSTAAWTPGDTAVSFGTGFETSVALPFPVTFYGHAFSTVDVQNWGAVAFTDTADSALGGGVQVWPGADPIFDAQSKVYTKTVGTGPNRQFVIEWRDVGLTGVTGTRVDLELVIAENSAITATIHNPPDRAVTSKDIEIYYWGNDYNSIQYYEDGNGLRAGKSVTFTPPTAA